MFEPRICLLRQAPQEDYVCLDGYEGISGWENMDELENSMVIWNSMVTSVENYTAMKWPVDCLHYTPVPFNYHIQTQWMKVSKYGFFPSISGAQ